MVGLRHRLKSGRRALLDISLVGAVALLPLALWLDLGAHTAAPFVTGLVVLLVVARPLLSALDLRRDHRRVTTLIDAIPLATIARDAEGTVLIWNKAAEDLFGWRADEVIGTENPAVPANEQAASLELFHRIQGGEQLRGLEVERLARDGTQLDLAVYSGPLDGSGGSLILYADVREQQQARRELDDAHRRYRELIEALPLVTYVDEIDDHATNVYTSPQVVDLLGWEPADWLANPTFFEEILHPDDLERVLDALKRANETRRPFKVEYRLRHRDGHYVWVRDESEIVAGSDERPRARGFLLDITAQKRLEEQLLQSQKMEALGQLAGGIAHDFNNLLTGIAGYAELATNASDDPLLSRCVQGIKTAAAEATGLTARLLAFSRRNVPELRLVDVNEAVHGAAELLERAIPANVDVNLSLDDDLPPVAADLSQLKQVLVNLALNARDAMRDGGSLTIETAHAEQTVVIRVRDTGFGMDAATRSRAYEPFFTTKPEGEGTGLGLAVAYGVVDALGGLLLIESEPGEGTTVTIVLPASEGVAEVVEAPPDPEQPQGSQARILVVEDRAVVRELTADVLTAAGFEVEVAKGGVEALAVVRRAQPFDLVLSDVVMPGMSGPELAERLRFERPELPVLYMSGYTDDVLAATDLTHPQTAFLRKPFRNTDLISAVRGLLDGQPWAPAAFANASS